MNLKNYQKEDKMQLVNTFTNTMDEYLKLNFGKVSISEMEKNLGIDYSRITPRIKRLNLDRKGEPTFKLEELKDLSDLLVSQTTIKEIVHFFSNKNICAILEQIEAIKNLSNLPNMELGINSLSYKWTDEEIKIIDTAIKKNISPLKIFLPTRTSSSISMKYYERKKIILTAEQETIKILKSSKDNCNEKEISKENSNKEIKYFLIWKNKKFLESTNLNFLDGYMTAIKDNIAIDADIKILKGYLEEIPERKKEK